MSGTVTWVKRQPRIDSNHSIERCFDAIESGFNGQLECPFVITSAVVPLSTNGVWSMIKNCARALNVRTDIAHVTGDINYVLPFLRSKRRLLTVHDVGHVQDPAHSAFKRWLLLLIWFRFPLIFCDTVICVSHQTLERLNHLVPKRRGQRRLVIPAAIREKSGQARGPRPYETDKKIVLQIGTAPNKNLHRVWKACEQLGCHLAIVGHETEEVAALKANRMLSHSIHTNVSDDALEQLYLHCDAVVFVSTHEGFGMPLIEAQTLGKPCVTSAIEPMKSNAGDGALLVDPMDTDAIRAALEQLLTNRELAETIVESGYLNARQFTGVEVARQHMRVYTEEVGYMESL